MSCFIPFELPTGARIPDRQVSVCDFGAVPGGEIKNTRAFAGAISALAAQGGGRLTVPRGLWLTETVTTSP